jgi:mRNA-degrading endonuclease RelE of RelBE toxin-antitoxin system
LGYYGRVPDEVPIIIYDDFAADWHKLGSEAQAQVKQLLRTLQVNPYEPNVQRKCLLHGERFEYPLDGGYSIFWKVHHTSIMKMKVLLLAIEPRQN